jgi:hypothetical protein
MLNYGLILVVALVGIGCGKSDKSSTDKPVISFPRKPDPDKGGLREDLNFSVFDENCQVAGSGSESLDQFKPLGLFNGQLSREDFVWSEGNSRESISTAFITETRIDYHQKLKCTYKAGDLACDKLSAAELISEGRKLKVCDPSRELSRNSLESIGLTSLAGIDRANHFMNRFVAENLLCPKLDCSLCQNSKRA